MGQIFWQFPVDMGKKILSKKFACGSEKICNSVSYRMLFGKTRSRIHNAGKIGFHVISCVTDYNFFLKSVEKDETWHNNVCCVEIYVYNFKAGHKNFG